MKKGEARVVRQHNKASYFALVKLEAEREWNNPDITSDCQGKTSASKDVAGAVLRYQTLLSA